LIFAVGHQHAKNIGVERQLSDRHMMACLYAGVKIGGSIRENGPSNAVDRGFEPPSGQTKDYKIDICCCY
jgi:hypothetical protein